jgi:hypothetical protein
LTSTESDTAEREFQAVFATASALIGTTNITMTADDMTTIDSDLDTCAKQSVHEIASSVMKGNRDRQEDDSDDDDDQSGISEPKPCSVTDAREAIATLSDFLLTRMRSMDDHFEAFETMERFVNKCATEEKKQRKMTEFFFVNH